MEYSDEYEKIRKWAPLLTSGRSEGDEAIACTRVEQGTDVDYGTLTKHLARTFIKLGGSFQALSTVRQSANLDIIKYNCATVLIIFLMSTKYVACFIATSKVVLEK